MSHKSQVTSYKKKQNGQIVLILLLVMTVALAIGLSIVQGSLVDITTSTKVEQSSRAFSAAEAGIERALQGSGVTTTESFSNNALFNLRDSGLLPKALGTLEYPPISKEEIVHVWLSDLNLTNDLLVTPTDPDNPVGKYYAQNQLEVYWSTPKAFDTDPEPAAVELTIVYFDETSETYKNTKVLLDPDETRVNNNFLKPSQSNGSFSCSLDGYSVATIFGEDRKFVCKANLTALPQTLVLLRARVLYSNSSHPFAIKPYTTPCPTNLTDEQKKDCSLPPQVRIVQSEGKAGDTQRTIQLFTVEKVVPYYFDYAIFSAGEINK